MIAPDIEGENIHMPPITSHCFSILFILSHRGLFLFLNSGEKKINSGNFMLIHFESKSHDPQEKCNSVLSFQLRK